MVKQRVSLAGGTSRGLVLDLIRTLGPISRVELAETTGLTQATMSTVVRQLLGEGLVEMLAAEPGLTVVAVPSAERARVECALAGTPQVVIFERGDPDRAVEILKLVPDALIIDVGIGPGPTFMYRREEIPAWPDAIVDAIRRSAHGAPDRDPVPVIVPKAVARS